MTGTDHVIHAAGLRKSFGRTAALDGLDLEVQAGEVHGLLGPNGAGKSTVIRVLLGLYRPDGGVVLLFGRDPWHDPEVLHRRLAYVPGDVNLWPSLSGGEAIDLLIRLRGGDPAASDRERLIEAFELDPSKPIRSYSKGNRQKVALVAAFALPTELYILDEPTSGLDPLMEQRFTEEVARVAQHGAAVLLSSHILAEVEELADRLSIIRRGRTVETGSLEQLRHLTASRYTVEADVDEARLQELRAVGTDLSHDKTTLSFSVEPHDTDRVLGILSQLKVRNLVVAPTSLEDLFMQHYGDDLAAEKASNR
ncbi:ABC transporter ATP-binding protein [Streptomyces albus]|uniref:ABC transporter ATP-binding protein n=1 Tax=Streptomyces albus TaxID=1888 RepID=UPI0004C8A463|nr:ABC transporter ATP-binding protein [Streptomyces albus]